MKAARNIAKVALWIAVLWVVVIGLQACATHKPTPRAKFDSTRNSDLHKQHKRWP